MLGIPEWWPTGSRVAVVLAHGSTSDLHDPLLEHVHRELTLRRCLTLRFNFPFAEARKRASSDSPERLDHAFRAAIATLGRDPSAAPAHLFIGGVGLGARVAARLATDPIRVDGLVLLNYPLHPRGKPELADAEDLYRIISPMLFVQGMRDPSCDVDRLRDALVRVGAPTRLQVVESADAAFKVTKKSGIDPRAVRHAVLEAIATWLEDQVGAL
ncbi:MAG: alpha/beta family hydrolase [Myxococcota bacterium]|nr:dienelactone hydrolase family protein [Myxococcales bacterium]